jgi:uncharacterized protein YjdB
LNIIFKDTPDAALSGTNGLVIAPISGLKINDKDANETFNKAYADGIVKFSQSGDGKAKTTYRVTNVEGYNSNTKIRDIHFYDANGNELKTDLGTDEVLTKDKEFTIQNSCSGEIQIMKMSYRVVRGSYEVVVTIDHATYPDYFKTTGGDKLTVYANSKDNCSVDNITIKVTGVSISGATATLASGANLQLEAIVAPANAANTGVKWASNNTGIATVSTAGYVTASLTNTGDVTITVTTDDG